MSTSTQNSTALGTQAGRLLVLHPTLQSKPQAHAKEAQTEVPAAEAIFDFESKEAAEKELLMLRNAALLSWRVRSLKGFYSL